MRVFLGIPPDLVIELGGVCATQTGATYGSLFENQLYFGHKERRTNTLRLVYNFQAVLGVMLSMTLDGLAAARFDIPDNLIAGEQYVFCGPRGACFEMSFTFEKNYCRHLTRCNPVYYSHISNPTLLHLVPFCERRKNSHHGPI